MKIYLGKESWNFLYLLAKKRSKADTRACQKSLVAIWFNIESPELTDLATLIKRVSRFQIRNMETIPNRDSKWIPVSRNIPRSMVSSTCMFLHLRIWTPFFFLLHTCTSNTKCTAGFFLEILARKDLGPNMVRDQGDRGSSEKPISPSLLTSELGKGSTIVRGYVTRGTP